MLERTHKAPPVFPVSPSFQQQRRKQCVRPWGGLRVCGRATFQVEFSLSRGSTSRGRTAVIVGAQWGDEGKGKIVDVLTQTFSVVARYAGGHNAGHTVIINGKKFILQLVPGGILRPECTSVVGNGVVIDPLAFLKEVASLRAAGVKVDGNLFVSNRAQVILPYHRMMELGSENAPGRVKIGTTSRGIGPSYEDKMGRRGLRVADLLDTPIAAHAHRERVPRKEHHRARAVQLRAARCRQNVSRVRRRRRADRSLCPRHGAAAEPRPGRRQVDRLRRRAGHHARHRSRHVSVRDLFELHFRWRRHWNRRAADID
jgi:hypothetical protein